jgi:hypothetical protein
MTIDEDAKSVLVEGAKKELAYLDQFGSPRTSYRKKSKNGRKSSSIVVFTTIIT